MDRMFALVSLLALGLGACERMSTVPDQPAPPSIKPSVSLEAPKTAIPDSILNREPLLAVLDQVTSAYAAGKDYPEAAAQLVNAKFSVRMPFACPGANGPTPTVSYDETAKVLRLSLKPVVFERGGGLWALVGDEESEHIEGFWLDRPWLRTPDCPIAAQAGATPEQTFALVQTFPMQRSRILRASARGFEAVLRGDVAAAAHAGSLRVVLEGRVADVADRRPIRCVAQDANQRPTCVLIVNIDRIAMESPSREVLSEWGG